MELSELRKQIDGVDGEIARLLKARMDLCAAVAEYKRGSGTPLRNETREKEILDRVSALAGDAYAPYAREIYEEILTQSRALQKELLSHGN